MYKTRNSEAFLSFRLSGEAFAIDVSLIENILEASVMEKQPGSLSLFSGIIYNKDEAIPVADIKGRLGLQEKENTPQTAIIVVNVGSEDEPVHVGIITDVIRELLETDNQRLSSAFSPITGRYASYAGYAWHVNNKSVMILDIRKLFTETEVEYFKLFSEQPVT